MACVCTITLNMLQMRTCSWPANRGSCSESLFWCGRYHLGCLNLSRWLLTMYHVVKPHLSFRHLHYCHVVKHLISVSTLASSNDQLGTAVLTGTKTRGCFVSWYVQSFVSWYVQSLSDPCVHIHTIPLVWMAVLGARWQQLL